MYVSCDHFICVQDRKTPLHLACARGAVGLVSELLAAGAQINASDKVSESQRRLISSHLSLFPFSSLPTVGSIPSRYGSH
jgi:hypothetical protein